MDIAQLAKDISSFLAPFLPYLILASEAAAKEAGKKFGEATWNKAVTLWEKLKQKPTLKEAGEKVARKPEDKRVIGNLEVELEDVFNEDAELAKFVEQHINIENMINIGGDVQNTVVIAGRGNKVINAGTYIQGNVYSGPTPRNPQDALKIYCGVMANSTKNLSLHGIDPKASDLNEQRVMDLANVYIDLDTTLHFVAVPNNYVGERYKAFVESGLGFKTLSVLEAIIKNQALVIKGDPGSGKSTFVNYLTYCLSAQLTSRLENWRKEDANLLPVVVILRDFIKSFKKLPEKAEPKHIWDFIEKRLKDQNLASASKPISELLEKGKVILFFDGLDEVTTIPQRVFVRDAVNQFAERYKKNRFVVTCRILSYTEPKKNEPELRLGKNFPEFEIAPFNNKQIQSFVSHWYKELTNLGLPDEQAQKLAENLLRQINGRKELNKLAGNPLLLTIMAVVNTDEGQLPDTRANLYETIIEKLLWQWEQTSKGTETARLRHLLQEADCSDADLKNVIWKLAYEAHAQTDVSSKDEEALAGVSELSLQKALAGINKNDLNWAARVIETMKLRAGLLLERENGVFTFPHRSFQEFLAGTYLESKDDFVVRAKELAENQLLWRQVILWAVSRRVFIRGSLDSPLALIAELCPKRDLTEKEWSKVWLAGDVLLEVGVTRAERTELGKELVPQVQNKLLQLIDGNHLTPRERAEAGDVLAQLGDPRFDSEKWFLPKEPLFGFSHIPAGEFFMGSDTLSDAQPKHSITLPDYWIMKYPVTVEQFNSFLLDSGYEPDDTKSKNGMSNHPVSYVTWHDALEYCEWLNEKFKILARQNLSKGILNQKEEFFWQGLLDKKLTITLPSEPEWEKAARGVNGLKYPWGSVPAFDTANNKDIGFSSTSTVGMFPNGKSVYGVFDMIGNIKEWTGSLWGFNKYEPQYKYPYRFDDGRENIRSEVSIYRVLRGGDYTTDVNESAYRFTPGNVNRAQEFGFRVVVTSFFR